MRNAPRKARCPGTTLQARNVPDRRRPCAAQVGGWSPAAAHATRTGCGVRSGGGEGSSLPDGGASSPASPGRFGYELVSEPHVAKRTSWPPSLVRKAQTRSSGFLVLVNLDNRQDPPIAISFLISSSRSSTRPRGWTR